MTRGCKRAGGPPRHPRWRCRPLEHHATVRHYNLAEEPVALHLSSLTRFAVTHAFPVPLTGSTKTSVRP